MVRKPVSPPPEREAEYEVGDSRLRVSTARGTFVVGTSGLNAVKEPRRQGRKTYSKIRPERAARLAALLDLSLDEFALLVDDVELAVLLWVGSPKTKDTYSRPDVQAVLTAAAAFCEQMAELSNEQFPRHPGTVGKKSTSRRLRKQQALIPVLQMISPEWSDPGKWDQRRALQFIKSLIITPDLGAPGLGDLRDVTAAAALIEIWKNRTAVNLSRGTSGKRTPYVFYMELLDGLRIDVTPVFHPAITRVLW